MIQLAPDLSNLTAYFKTLVAEHNVVGASLAVLDNEIVHTAAAGSLNLETQVDVTTDSLFQIGSISKVFTATLIMQLVDEGKVRLDEPVKTYLPDFHVADSDATVSITIRQLLCHTSGMEGDFFPEDDPEGPSASSYLTKCHLLPQLHPPGDYFSYSNSAFVVLGRVIEIVEGITWAKAISLRLLKPLGMDHSIVEPHESLRFRMAMGHVPDLDNDGKPMLANRCYLVLSTGPAGAVLSMSATDLLKFARMHLESGIPSAGERVLSVDSVEAMQASQIRLSSLSWQGITDWGLGWFLKNDANYSFVGHDGATRGQFAYLRLFPEYNKAIALLTNSDSRSFMQDIEKDICRVLELGRVENSVDVCNEQSTADIEPGLYTGTYRNLDGVSHVTANSKRFKRVFHSARTQVLDQEEYLTPVSPGRFTCSGGGDAVFVGHSKGQPAQYMYSGFRLMRRITSKDISKK